MSRKLDESRPWVSRHAAGKIIGVSDRRAERMLIQAGITHRRLAYGPERTQIEFSRDGVLGFINKAIQPAT